MRTMRVTETIEGGEYIRHFVRAALTILVSVIVLGSISACGQDSSEQSSSNQAALEASTDTKEFVVHDKASESMEVAETPKEQNDASQPNGWIEREDGVRVYYDPKTHEVKAGLITDKDGKRYYLDEEGVPLLGWQTIEGKTYHFADGGAADTGWVTIDENTYCFDNKGAMKTGWADGEDGKKRWLKEDGVMASHEWVEVDGVWKVFEEDGSWVKGDGKLPANDAENYNAMTDAQRAVVASCDTTPWQGKGWCAAWVSLVFQNADQPYVGGDACDMYYNWCLTDDIDELKPGMLVAVPSHPQSENGVIWGHVCIYVGNGMVRDNGGYCVRIMELTDWIAWFGATHTVKWGWASGINLEAT